VRKSLDLELHKKAAVAAGTTVDPTFAGPLLVLKPMTDAFLAVARSASLIGRLPLRRVPFRTKCPLEITPANYKWVKENSPKPVSAMAFSNGITLGPTKAEGTVVVTKETVKMAVAGMTQALERELVGGLSLFTDIAFIDPASTVLADERPGSVTSGTTPVAGTADLPKDIKALLKAFYAGRPGATQTVLIMGPGNASEIPTTMFREPILVSQAAGTNVIALDPDAVLLADNGMEFSHSEQATLEMNDAPTNPVTAAVVLVSMWQLNSIAFRVERFLNFQAVTGAVKYLTTP
jgi:hypothetical protein